MDELNLYKEFYFNELERRKEANEAINTPILVLTIVISVHTYVFAQNEKVVSSIFEWLAGASIATGVCVVLAVWYLLKSIAQNGRTYTYKYLSGMEKYIEYKEDLKEAGRSQKAVKAEFMETLKMHFAKGSSINFEINNLRFEYLGKAKKFTAWAVISTVLLSGLFMGTLLFNYMGNNNNQDKKKETPKPAEVKPTIKFVAPPPFVDVQGESKEGKK